MIKYLKYTVLLAVLLMLISSCRKDFNETGKDNNRASSVNPSYLLNSVLYDIYDEPYGDYTHWCQYFLCNYDYYGNNEYEFGSGATYYTTLKNVVKMEEEASALGLPEVNCYEAMAKFFKAYFFTKMSLEMGDIPMTEALEGLNNLTPKYDTQKAVFVQAFKWLESANSDMNTLKSTVYTMDGDFYFDNDIEAWQKVVNTFRIRLLLHLSKKTDDSDLNVKGQFEKIISDSETYPLMESSDDNLEFVYLYPTNEFPKTPDNYGQNAYRENCSNTYVSLLTKFNDPRVFVTCEPASALFDNNNPSSMDAFVGADPGEDLGSMYVKANAGKYSLLNRYRYYRTYVGENNIQIGYPELCFNIAEAINRGWSTTLTASDAESYYKKGIEASMIFYGIPSSGTFTAYFIKSGYGVSASGAFDAYSISADFDTYYNQDSVAYLGNNSNGLLQILRQRYLALYIHSGLESYFTYRRTGVPEFTTGTGTGNSARIAWRFQYPSSEQSTNTTNYQAALDSQYDGDDDINGVMWILK
jgi:hypothetical protein